MCNDVSVGPWAWEANLLALLVVLRLRRAGARAGFLPYRPIYCQTLRTSRLWLRFTHCALKRDTIYKWIERKSMPAHKVGSLWKFRKEEIDCWVRDGNAAGPNVSRKQR